MPALTFHAGQKERLTTVLRRALEGATYESSQSLDGGMFEIAARRPDGKGVHVRFHGVQSADAAAATPGSSLSLRRVRHQGGMSLINVLFRSRAPRMGSARVTIGAGQEEIEVVCEDADWWEEPR